MFDWFLNKSLYGEQHMKDLQKKYSGKQENHFWLKKLKLKKTVNLNMVKV